MMFKSILIKIGIYLVILVFIVPVIILVLVGNASRRTAQESNQDQTPGVPVSMGTPVSSASQNVPLPSKEDIVRTFCELIDEGRISDAVSMIDTTDKTAKQTWVSV